MDYTYHVYHYSSDDHSDDVIDYDDYQKKTKLDHDAHLAWLVLALTAVAVIIIGLLYNFNLLPHRAYTDADFDIETYHSSVDQDSDDLDDQADILASARAYLGTKPQYQSIYYASGYPDDNHGVCTDVIAFALKGAGYDLMALVDEDIMAHPEFYDVETPDHNIDFRRVKNLEVWLRRHAKSLTTDLDDISAWQGGDIVAFKDHIGLISDKRNRKGVPFLIHHYSPVQPSYEEDVLKNYQILGHYRIS